MQAIACIFVSFELTSFSIILSKSTHVVENGKIPFCFYDWVVLFHCVYMCVCVYIHVKEKANPIHHIFFIHSSVEGQTMLLWTLGYIQFSCSVVSDSLRPHGLQHARLPCPSPTPGACSNSCPLSRWCHPTISSSVVPFSSCLQLGCMYLFKLVFLFLSDIYPGVELLGHTVVLFLV